MFTVEINEKTSSITIVCDENLYPDIKLVIGDAEVFISQHCDDTDTSNTVRISNRQFAEMLLSMDYEEGVYNTTLKK